MKLFGLSLLAAIVGYFIGLFGGMSLVETFSSNAHDRSMEAAMTASICDWTCGCLGCRDCNDHIRAQATVMTVILIRFSFLMT